MARTNDNWLQSNAGRIAILMPIPLVTGCPPSVPQKSEFDQWWEANKGWHSLTGRIERGELPLSVKSVEQQYRLDLVRQGKMEHMPGLRDLYQQIEELATVEDDWNGEGAPVIDRGSIEHAQAFVMQLACEAPDLTDDSILPSVYPTVDGGVQLYLNKADSQVALTFRPGGRGIDYLMKKLGEPAQRGSLLVKDALAKALQAIRNA